MAKTNEKSVRIKRDYIGTVIFRKKYHQRLICISLLSWKNVLRARKIDVIRKYATMCIAIIAGAFDKTNNKRSARANVTDHGCQS